MEHKNGQDTRANHTAARVSSSIPGRMKISHPFTMFYKIKYGDQILHHAVFPGSVNSLIRPNDDDQHQHEHFELLYVLEGELVNQIEQINYHYKKGDACLLNRNTRHADIPGDNCAVVFLNLSAEFISSLLKNDVVCRRDGQSFRPDGKIHQFLSSNLKGEDGFARNYLEFSPVSLALNDGREKKAQTTIDMIQQELLEQRPGCSYLIQGMLLRLIHILEDESIYHSNFIHLDTGRQDFLFARITNYLKESAGDISREELSKALNYNAEYLNQIVKKRTGLSLMQLGRACRLERARQLLEDTDKSISSIIRELGFISSSHFYSFFRKEMGMSPMEYRKGNCCAHRSQFPS